MKISLALKLSLFSFLSALACVIANSFIELTEITVLVDILWFAAYVFLVIWVCRFITQMKKMGKNLVVAFFSFSIALYFGIYSGISEEGALEVVGSVLFYISAIVCLGSVLLMIGRLVFAQPNQAKAESGELPAEQADTWKCVCGHVSTGKFCSKCGSSKPQ